MRPLTVLSHHVLTGNRDPIDRDHTTMKGRQMTRTQTRISASGVDRTPCDDRARGSRRGGPGADHCVTGQARFTRMNTNQFGVPTTPQSTISPVKVTIGAPVRALGGSEQNPFNLTVVGGQDLESFSVWSAAAPLNGPLQQAWSIWQVDDGLYQGELTQVFNATATNTNTLSVSQQIYGTILPGIAPMDIGTQMGLVLHGSELALVVQGNAYGPGTPFIIEIEARSF
jgi:hypothetical protein